MSFDRLAPHYRWMEFVLAGGKLQRARTAFLDSISTVQSVLLVGEGHGRFLAECARRLPNAEITMIDSSAGMLDVARANLANGGLMSNRVHFLHKDILKWSPSCEHFDAIVTHFFLDCFPEEHLAHVVQKLAASAQANATWLIADFQIPASGSARVRARAIHALMYFFFRFVTRLPARRWIEPDSFLRANGFELRERLVSEWGLLRSDLWRRDSAQGSRDAT